MDLSGWALYALTAAAGLAMVAYLYGRREMPGRGRKLLAGLRWAVVAILLLLLFDPDLPTSPLSGRSERVQVLLDGSLSMAMPVRAGESSSRWNAAIEEARRVAGKGEVLVFGDGTRAVAADSLAGLEPGSPRSRLAPALRAAAEAGARRVVVVTDGGIDDLPEVNRLLPLLGLKLEVRTVGEGEVGNRALAEVEAPVWAEAGKSFEVRVGVGALGGVADSARIVLRQGERVVAEGVVAAPEPGRLSTAVLSVTPEAAAEGEMVRYDIALEPGDAVPDDDRRSIYVQVDEQPAGVTILSFRADWELRFLQPVLAQSLGLPVKGYLQAQPGKFIRLAGGAETGLPVEETEVRRELERARIVVLHGLDGSAPAWARSAARSARRALVFPAGNGVPDLPLASSAPIPGDWAATRSIPASPVAELMAGLQVDGLPPLSAARPVDLPAGAWTPLVVERGAGAGAPVAAGLEEDGRRTVVALADGFWRWAFRDGAPRQAYRRLWSALGGWLLEDERLVDAGPLRPLSRVTPRGEAVRWVGAGATTSPKDTAHAAVSDSATLRVSDATGTVVVDTVLGVSAGDTLALPALPPGSYRYEVRQVAVGDSETTPAGGEFVVESYSPEFLRQPVAIAEIEATAAESAAAVQRSGPTRPLHTEPWPYVALVLLVSTEWIFRRRWGLR